MKQPIIYRYKKGFKNFYAFAIKRSKNGSVIVIDDDSKIQTFDSKKISKCKVVCTCIETPEGQVGLSFSDRQTKDLLLKETHDVNVENFDKYKFASEFGPIFYALRMGLNRHSIEAIKAALVQEFSREEYEDKYKDISKLLLDAYRFGVGEHFDSSFLVSTDEKKWLEACAASVNDNHKLAISLCEELADGKFPERNILAIQAIRNGCNPNDISRAVNEKTGLGQYLQNLDTENSGEVLFDAFESFAGSVKDQRVKESWVNGLKDLRILQGDNAPSTPNIAIDNMGSFLAFEDTVKVGTNFRIFKFLSGVDKRKLQWEEIFEIDFSTISLPVIDDLIDSNVFSDETSQNFLFNSRKEYFEYLSLRVNPASLEDSELKSDDATEERNRRELLSALEGTLDTQENNYTAVVKLKNHKIPTGEEIEKLPAELQDKAKKLGSFLVKGDLKIAEELFSDPTLHEVIHRRLSGEDTTNIRSGALSQLFAAESLSEALENIYTAKWEIVISICKEVLRQTNEEEITDEALNLIACAYWQIGEDEKAIAALRQALEGEYNRSLQVNIGVIAGNIDPVNAAQHLAQLAKDAPDLELKVEAIVRGIQIWHEQTKEETTQSEALPLQLREGLRSLFHELLIEKNNVEDDLTWQIFWRAANDDDDWLVNEQDRLRAKIRAANDKSLIKNREDMLEVAIAKATGFAEYIDVVTALDSQTDWSRKAKEELREMIELYVIHFSAWQIGLMYFEKNKRSSDDPAADLQLMLSTLVGCAFACFPDDDEPEDQQIQLPMQVVDIFKRAKTLFNDCSQDEKVEFRERFDLVGEQLLRAAVVSWAGFLSTASDFANRAVMAGYRLNRTAEVRNAMNTFFDGCDEICKIFESLADLIDMNIVETELKTISRDFLDQARNMRDIFGRLR